MGHLLTSQSLQGRADRRPGLQLFALVLSLAASTGHSNAVAGEPPSPASGQEESAASPSGPCSETPAVEYPAEQLTRNQLKLLPAASEGPVPDVIGLMIPGRLYRESVQPYPGANAPAGPLDSLGFWILFVGDHGTQGGIVQAEWSLCSGKQTLETRQLGPESLKAREHPLIAEQNPELWSASHHLLLPGDLQADGVVYKVRWGGQEPASLTFHLPVERYEQKTALRLPLDEPARVEAGHLAVEHHRGEGSQWFALDLAGVDATTLAAVRTSDGLDNENFHGWGRNVVAPGSGTVVAARDGVPDNPRAGKGLDPKEHPELDDPVAGVAGNHVVIDHGNDEFSFLGHLQQGSIAVAVGDSVTQGQLVGPRGNSGNSSGPHLHYHLMACGQPFRCNGLPVRFEGVEIPYEGTFESYAPVRGTVLVPR